MTEPQKQRQYNSYITARTLPYNILNLLMTDTGDRAEEFWKLLKYDSPIGKDNLTLDQKRAMICTDSININNYNVAMQKFSEEAMTTDDGAVFAQMRLQVLAGLADTDNTGKVSVLIQLVVTDKKMTCNTDVSPYDNRAFALCQDVIACLNGKPLTDNGNYIFLNNNEDYDSGFKLVNFNKEYSGYVLMMTANINS